MSHPYRSYYCSISNLRNGGTPTRQSLKLVPSLLATCHQVYQEGTRKLYSDNAFFTDLAASWQPRRESCKALAGEEQNICSRCRDEADHQLARAVSPRAAGWRMRARCKSLYILITI